MLALAVLLDVSVCSLPAAYCEHGPDFEKCRHWLLENAPHLDLELGRVAADQLAENLEDTLKMQCRLGSTSDSKYEEVEKFQGGKVKRKEKPDVVVEEVVRNKKIYLTFIKGLDVFGVELSDALKKIGRSLPTGASAVKGLSIACARQQNIFYPSSGPIP